MSGVVGEDQATPEGLNKRGTRLFRKKKNRSNIGGVCGSERVCGSKCDSENKCEGVLVSVTYSADKNKEQHRL